MATSALLVEDDVRIREALTLALADEDIDVVPAVSGEQALELAERVVVQVVLLDLMLPGVDGLTVCRALRDRGELPIIIITARSETQDVIRGLEAGADDYVTKPLVASELAARIRALLRRRAPAGPVTVDELRIADLEVLPKHGVVRKRGADVHLTRTEFRLLLEIAGAGGQIVTREELLHRVWGYDYFGDTRLLDVHIRRLRRKVEDNPDSPTIVRTVRGVGYKAPRP
jgi:two-component system, OmpR family, response regulator MtrA